MQVPDRTFEGSSPTGRKTSRRSAQRAAEAQDPPDEAHASSKWSYRGARLITEAHASSLLLWRGANYSTQACSSSRSHARLYDEACASVTQKTRLQTRKMMKNGYIFKDSTQIIKTSLMPLLGMHKHPRNYLKKFKILGKHLNNINSTFPSKLKSSK